jgi:hypothetical protein
MHEQLSMHVSLFTLALLCYRLLFHSDREASLTALLFCASCAWCAGQIATAAAGTNFGETQYSALVSAAMHAVRAACSGSFFSASAREACHNYTSFFIPYETA